MCSREKISIDFSEAKTIHCLFLRYNGVNSYLCANKTEIYKFRMPDNIHSSVEKEDILSIHECLMAKNNVK